MIFVSDHAFISKWWCSGAIRKIRLPQYLNESTCSITEQRLDHEDPADEEQEQLDLEHDRHRRDRAPERHRARVAHEHLGGERVEPEEADRRADQRRADECGVEPVLDPAVVRGRERM